MANDMLSYILKNLPEFMSKGADLIINIAKGFIDNLPEIVSAVVKMITEFIATIAENLPDILQQGIEIIGKLVAGLIQAIPDVVAAIPKIISAITDEFGKHDWLEIGTNIVKGIASGILGALGVVTDAIKKVGNSIVSGAKKFFKIASPSKLFRDEIGSNIGKGLALGLTDSIPVVEKAMSDVDDALITSGLTSDIGFGMGGMPQTLPALLPATDNKNMTIVLELDGYQFGRAVYKYNQNEMQRVGVNLAGGFA
jgi:hypothetical protein